MAESRQAHRDRLREALAAEADGQRALLAGEAERGVEAMRRAAELYRASWELAPPGSYGRLIGMLKAAAIAGDASSQAAYAREQLAEARGSAVACYALAIAALVLGDDALVRTSLQDMRDGSEALERTATAMAAIAEGDAAGYAEAVEAIVADFEARDQHLTGVAIADTALMLERIAATRGMSCGLSSPLLPPATIEPDLARVETL